jgi:hypothetical protein
MHHHFGFGDFIFRLPNGEEFTRARNLSDFANKIKEIPPKSLVFHAQRNHFSIWLRARTEFELADEIRPKQVSDFKDIEGLRNYIHSAIHQVLQALQKGVIKDFKSSDYYTDSTFIQMGSGSLGGKGRGIAFINAMLADNRLTEKFPDLEIKIPQTFVLGTEVFEDFIESNELQQFAIQTIDEKLINKNFLQSPLPSQIFEQLKTFLNRVHFPLAIRSSSLLEDSQLLPFAGLYKTYMLANSNPDFEVRLQQLTDAIRLIYASVYHRQAKEYVKNTDYRIEEEKMAIVIQQCVGMKHGDHFYPIISGVAQSFNYYPLPPMHPEEGIIHLALGLGKIIMDGGQIYRFSPQHPEMNLPYGSAEEFLENSQSQFYAINFSNHADILSDDEDFNIRKFDIDQAEKDGSLFFVGSTFSPQDQTIKDTLSIEGPRIITFANILKYKIFPLPEIINEILDLGKRALGTHVEIEFCVNLSRDPQEKPELYVLQIRPMVAGGEIFDVSINPEDIENSICFTNHAIGNGSIEDIQDIVYVNPRTFDISKTDQIALEIEKMNHSFIEKQKKYVLIGFGRWGTSDPWLGIPTNWYQVCGAKVIIESFFEDLKIEPSQGSHFFHNLISLRLGYFYIKGKPHADYIDWQWLQKQTPEKETKYLKHVCFRKPLNIKIHGKTGQGIIFKPQKN